MALPAAAAARVKEEGGGNGKSVLESIPAPPMPGVDWEGEFDDGGIESWSPKKRRGSYKMSVTFHLSAFLVSLNLS